ncbi:hypothetical protein ABIB57_003081 [Devosia sp. UYZn731]
MSDCCPGMPVETFVKTEDRTVLSYMIRPFVEQLHRARLGPDLTECRTAGRVLDVSGDLFATRLCSNERGPAA